MLFVLMSPRNSLGRSNIHELYLNYVLFEIETKGISRILVTFTVCAAWIRFLETVTHTPYGQYNTLVA